VSLHVQLVSTSNISVTGRHLLPTPDLLDVMENIDDVPVSPRSLLDLAGQGEAGHGDDVEGETDE